MDKIVKVNLGAGRQAYEHPGYISVDIIPGDGIDIVWNCERGLPREIDRWGDVVWETLPLEKYERGEKFVGKRIFPDDTVDEFLCKHFLEHLSNGGFMRLMDEMWDALKSGGLLHVQVPNCEHSKAAYGDPTHKMHFHLTTFGYFTKETLAAFPYTDRAWKIIEGYPKLNGTPPDDLYEIEVWMTPDK